MTLRTQMNGRRLGLMLLGLLLGAVSAHAADPTGQLSAERWREQAYGISFLPPVNSRMVQQTGDLAIVRCIHDQGFALVLSVRKMRDDLPADLELVRAQALQQMGAVNPAATLLDDVKAQYANRPARVLYYYLPVSQRGQWVTAQAFVQFNDTSFVLIELETPRDHYEIARPMYEAVLASLQFDNPDQVVQRRAQLAQQGEQWAKAHPPAQLADSLVREQWLRMVEGSEDVGYLKIVQSRGPLDEKLVGRDPLRGTPGVRVDVQSRVIVGDTAYDSMSNFFVSDDREVEVWSIRTTERPLKPKQLAKLQPQRGAERLQIVTEADLSHSAWAETWIRKGDKITLVRRSPAGDNQVEWTRPPVGYLSQAELYLMAPALPTDGSTLGFYAYHPHSGKIAFREERAERLPDGKLRVYSRLSPEQVQEQVTDYTGDGTIVVRKLPGGREMVPTSLRELTLRWKLAR